MKVMDKSYYGKLTLVSLLATLVSIMFCTVLFMLVLATSNVYGQSAITPYLTLVLILLILMCTVIYFAHIYFTYKRLSYVNSCQWAIICSLLGLHLIPVIIAIAKKDPM